MSTKKNDKKAAPQTKQQIQQQEDRKDNRFRLNAEEIDILEHFRAHGTVPDSSHVLSDINKSNILNKHSTLKKRYAQSLNDLNQANAQLETLIDLRNMNVKPYIIKPSMNIKESHSTMCVVASDWHLEETVDASTVNDLNEFDLDIARKRSDTFFKKSLLMHNLLSKSFNINHLVLALLGDFINGYIHEEMVEENSLSPTQAILEAKKMLISGINFILENADFQQITIPCCFGNHGRTTPKMRISSSYKNSFEWLMYKDLEMYYADNPKVKFIVANSYHNFVNIYGKYLVRFHHGDSIRYSGGVGGLSIPVYKAIASWNRSIPAYLDVFGHFHTSVEGGNFIANGSLVGFNPYATFIKAPFEEPMQSMFVINEQYGKILSAPLFIDDAKHAKK